MENDYFDDNLPADDDYFMSPEEARPFGDAQTWEENQLAQEFYDENYAGPEEDAEPSEFARERAFDLYQEAEQGLY